MWTRCCSVSGDGGVCSGIGETSREVEKSRALPLAPSACFCWDSGSRLTLSLTPVKPDAIMVNDNTGVIIWGQLLTSQVSLAGFIASQALSLPSTKGRWQQGCVRRKGTSFVKLWYMTWIGSLVDVTLTLPQAYVILLALISPPPELSPSSLLPVILLVRRS
jgi:hypothetical protein